MGVGVGVGVSLMRHREASLPSPCLLSSGVYLLAMRCTEDRSREGQISQAELPAWGQPSEGAVGSVRAGLHWWGPWCTQQGLGSQGRSRGQEGAAGVRSEVSSFLYRRAQGCAGIASTRGKAGGPSAGRRGGPQHAAPHTGLRPPC